MGPRVEFPCGCVMDEALSVVMCREHLSACSTFSPSAATATDKLFALELDTDPDIFTMTYEPVP